jgi:hypothetical protein
VDPDADLFNLAGYLLISVSGFWTDIRQANPVSGWIPDIKKAGFIRPDIRPGGYLLHCIPIHHNLKFCFSRFFLCLFVYNNTQSKCYGLRTQRLVRLDLHVAYLRLEAD